MTVPLYGKTTLPFLIVQKYSRNTQDSNNISFLIIMCSCKAKEGEFIGAQEAIIA